jgi:hypothetical protein
MWEWGRWERGTPFPFPPEAPERDRCSLVGCVQWMSFSMPPMRRPLSSPLAPADSPVRGRRPRVDRLPILVVSGVD